MLVRLLYASRAVVPFTETTVTDILEQSRRHNPALGITGVLCYSAGHFVQVLEGGRDEVCELYNSLVGDPRHTQVRILLYEEIAKRTFGGWTMGQVEIDRVNPSLLLKYAERAELSPFTTCGHASMSLLEELIASGVIVNRSA